MYTHIDVLTSYYARVYYIPSSWLCLHGRVCVQNTR